ncbi:transcription repressor OFP13-like [Miscanthus floridulus]|uniref:transcription repressor OFP13-like n=1 Tax=Miscanthus floridulus TaxID=154761 RepID=UPI003459369B
MVKKQQLAVGGLTGVFSSSTRSIHKPQDTASPPSSAAAAAGEVLPWHPSCSSAWRQWQWQWTSCGMHPRTLSFRQQQQLAEQEEEDPKNGHGRHRQQQQQRAAYYKTINSVDFSGDSSFASVDSFASTASEEAESDAEAVILQALRSDRLLYEPADDDIEDDDASCCRLIKQPSLSKQQAAVADNDGDDKPQLDNSSIVLSSGKASALAFGGATAMSVDSHNPYRDFRESMEAMVMSQLEQEGGVKDWSWLEEMLGWYLKANAKTTHSLIVAAFVDLLLALTNSPAADAADYNYSSSSSSPVATPPASASATNCSASSIDDCSCCSSSSSL